MACIYTKRYVTIFLRKEVALMRRKLKGIVLSLILVLQLAVPSIKAYAAETLYDNRTGTQDGYSFELWKDYGNTSMTLNAGGNFECSWSNIVSPA